MHLWRPALTLFTLILVFGASFVLLIRVIGISSPWLHLLLMFNFLGLAKFAQPLFTFRLPKALSPLRRWELDGRVYRRFRVLEFGRLLRQTPLRYLNSAVYLSQGHRDHGQVYLQVKSAEAIHFWAAVLFFPCIAYAGLNGMWQIVIGFSLVQVLGNIYPILHLRHIRGRLDRAFQRVQATQMKFKNPDNGA